MSGAKKTLKDITSKDKLRRRLAPNPFKKNEVDNSFANPSEVLEQSVKDVGAAFTPEIPAPEEPVIIPIPDEQTAALEAKRRRARAPKTGRDSTILTEGLGG